MCIRDSCSRSGHRLTCGAERSGTRTQCCSNRTRTISRDRALNMGNDPPGENFIATRWSRVLEARGEAPEARAALSDLCAAYYAPVLAFLRRERGDEDA